MRPVTRRSLLAGGLAVVAAGVGGAVGWLTAPGQPTPMPTPAPRSPVLEAQLARVQALLARMDATIAAGTPLAAALGPVRADHAAHATTLTDLLRAAGVAVAPTSSGASTASPAPSSAPSSGPASGAPAPFTAASEVAAAETASAQSAAAASLVLSGAVAATMASMSACCAGHSVLFQ